MWGRDAQLIQYLPDEKFDSRPDLLLFFFQAHPLLVPWLCCRWQFGATGLAGLEALSLFTAACYWLHQECKTGANRTKQVYLFLKHQKAPQSLGKQKWGKHYYYIQILEYIPFEPTDLPTSSYGNVAWVDYEEQIDLIVLFETQHQATMPRKNWFLDESNTCDIFPGSLLRYDCYVKEDRTGIVLTNCRCVSSLMNRVWCKSANGHHLFFPHFSPACCSPNVNSNYCIGCGIRGVSLGCSLYGTHVQWDPIRDTSRPH